MKTNNQTKPKNKIFIIWGLFITGVILIFLIILLLALKPQTNVDTQNKQTLQPNVDAKKEQETYNMILNKINKEVDKLTQQEQQTSTLKYPPKTIYQKDGKTPFEYQIYDLEGNLIKSNIYDKNGNIVVIDEYQKGFLKKSTFLNPDGTIKETKTY